MAYIPPPPPGLPPAARHRILPSAALPSAAAAAGAAAAALLQRQLAEGGGNTQEKASNGWTEHQTGDGRKFYFNEESQTSVWEKPDALMSLEERSSDTKWHEYRIWDGRVFYHNKETKVSCWSMPPEIRRLRGELSGIDDRPMKLTLAEQRSAFWDLLKEKGCDATWTWPHADKVTRFEPQSQVLDGTMRKQIFAELLSYLMQQKQIASREKQRNAASALERLIEERFSRPEDLSATYEDAARLLRHEEPWELIRSEVRRDEVFQGVMERLEEKHQKDRAERRSERVLRLQRLMASDPELRRSCLRWKDAVVILGRRDELQEEDPPLEALRVWSSLRDLRPAAEHDAENKTKSQPDPAAYREERRRRDAFNALLEEMVSRGTLMPETSWEEFENLADGDSRFAALLEGPGSTAMELFDGFRDDLSQGLVMGLENWSAPLPDVIVGQAPQEADGDAETTLEPPPKRQRFSSTPPPHVIAQQVAGSVAVREGMVTTDFEQSTGIANGHVGIVLPDAVIPDGVIESN